MMSFESVMSCNTDNRKVNRKFKCYATIIIDFVSYKNYYEVLIFLLPASDLKLF